MQLYIDFKFVAARHCRPQRYKYIREFELQTIGLCIHRLAWNSATFGSSTLCSAERDRAAQWVSYGQKWKTGTGIQHFTDIIGLSSTTVT